MPSARTWILLLGVTSPAPVVAQTVWNVTAPNGIQTAIAAASPGDVIVLTASGGFPDYHPFTLDKGLTIRGNGARIFATPGGAQAWIEVLVPAGQIAHVENVQCTYFVSPYPNPVGGCPVRVTAGNARFEDCLLGAGADPGLVVSGSTVVVSGGTVFNQQYPYGGVLPSAIDVVSGHLTLRDCSVTGGTGTCTGWGGSICSMPGAALRATNSVVHAERVQFEGGPHTVGANGFGAPAIVSSASSVRLADCNATGGWVYVGAGGSAVVNAGPTAIELRNTALAVGYPHNSPVTVGPISPNAPLVRLAIAPAWTRGSTSTLTCSGNANTLFAIALAPDPTPASIGVVAEPVWFVTGAAVLAGVLDPAGAAAVPIAVPNVPALQHLTVWCQAVSGNTLPLRASTLAGGVVH